MFLISQGKLGIIAFECYCHYGHVGLCYMTCEAQPIMADP